MSFEEIYYGICFMIVVFMFLMVITADDDMGYE